MISIIALNIQNLYKKHDGKQGKRGENLCIGLQVC